MENQTPPPQTEPAKAVSKGWRQPALIIAVLALGMLLAQWFINGHRMGALQEELAQRLNEGDNMARESRAVSHQTQEDVQSLIARIGVLEARLNEAQGQQETLTAMYQELASGRDDRLLAEIEQAVAIAAQQLQLAGNVEAALIALQSAEARLARNNNAQFAGLRRLLTRDIEKLKALPQADISGMAIKLEAVVTQVDSLPLAYTQRPLKESAKKDAANSSDYWNGLLTETWQDIRSLVRIERMDQTAPALLAPSQSLFLRENLRLRLVNARLSLLQRDARSFRDDVQLSIKWLNLYFDMRNNSVKSAHDSLQKLAGANLNLTLPSLDETLATVRNIKLPRDKK